MKSEMARAPDRNQANLFLFISLTAAAIAILPAQVNGWACTSKSDCDYPGCNDVVSVILDPSNSSLVVLSINPS